MNKKILFLGYKPFLGSILYHLKDAKFIEENSIDIIFATSSKSTSIKKKLIKHIKNNNYSKIYEEIKLRVKLFPYKKSNYNILTKLFPEKNIDFLNIKKNVQFLEYNGLDEISNLENYDFLIVASFGEKIPKNIFMAPKNQTLNIHPSYLPKLRGGYPTYVEAFNFENTSSSTIHYMEKGWDNGDVIIQKKEVIKAKSSNQNRILSSAKIAAKLLIALNDKGFVFNSEKQDQKYITYCHKIVKYKNNVRHIEENNIEKYVLANLSKSLFPFTYGYYKGVVVSVLAVKRTSRVFDIPKIRFFVKEKQLFLQHYKDEFRVLKFIYKGKLKSQF